MNIGLAIFNLIPIPPLDGSKILFALLPPHLYHVRETLERYGFVAVLIFILILSKFDVIEPVVSFIFEVLTGLSLP